jgi:hypothetical protein
MTSTLEYTTLPAVEARRQEIDAEVETRANQVEGIVAFAQDRNRDLNGEEQAQMRAHTTRLASLRQELDRLEQTSMQLQVETRSRQIGDVIAQATGRRPDPRGHSRLLVSEEHLRSHADAIRAGSVFGAEESELYERAAVTVATDLGSPGDWGRRRSPGR